MDLQVRDRLGKRRGGGDPDPRDRARRLPLRGRPGELGPRELRHRADPGAGQAPDRVAVEGWITEGKARDLLKAGGRDFDALKKAAAKRDFRPVPLGCSARFQITNELREEKSRNVVARLEGSDPVLKNELLVYSAHWDHLGRDPERTGDQIFNGAADNASGVAAVLEIARAFTRIAPAPKRSILFLATTAEEQGLLGAKYYAEHPLYPLERTLANINLDVINLWGPTSDIISIGMGQSDLDDRLVEIAGRRGRTVVPDADPEKGYYYRSDHFEFAKRGVPRSIPRAAGGTRASRSTTASASRTSTPRRTTTSPATRSNPAGTSRAPSPT